MEIDFYFNSHIYKLKKLSIMSKKMFALVSGIVGGLQTIGVAVVTYTQPEYATAINSAIVIAGAAIIEICNLFTTSESMLRKKVGENHNI